MEMLELDPDKVFPGLKQDPVFPRVLHPDQININPNLSNFSFKKWCYFFATKMKKKIYFPFL